MVDTVYADFTCPLSYLASFRPDRLSAIRGQVPQWRAVAHRPSLPLVGIRLDKAGRATRQAQFERVREHLAPGEQGSRLRRHSCCTRTRRTPPTPKPLTLTPVPRGIGTRERV